MMSRMVGSVLTLLSLLFSVEAAVAQTYTQMQWGMNKGVTPYQFGANINGVWSNLGTVSSSGVWSIPPSNITGLGTAATRNIGTSGANVPLLNGVNTWGAVQTFPNASIPSITLAAQVNNVIDLSRTGAPCNGTGDDTTYIQSSLATLGAYGGGELLLCKQVRTTATVNLLYSNVYIRGRGAEMWQSNSAPCINAGTAWTWAGAAGGTMINTTPAVGASNPLSIGGGVSDVCLNGNNVAGRGVYVVSTYGISVERIMLWNFTTAALDFYTTGPYVQMFGTQRTKLNQIRSWQSGSAPNVRFDANNTYGNTSVSDDMFVFELAHCNGAAIEFRNSDNLTIHGVRASFTGGSCTGAALEFFGGPAPYEVARANIVIGLSAAAVGGATQKTIMHSDGVSPSYGNQVLEIDDDNGTPTPVDQSGNPITPLLGTFTTKLTGGWYWQTYTPTVTFVGGTGGTATASGRWARQGKLACVYMQVSITDAGSGNTSIRISLPSSFTPTALTMLNGLEYSTTGQAVFGAITTGSTYAIPQTAAGSTSALVTTGYGMTLDKCFGV